MKKLIVALVCLTITAALFAQAATPAHAAPSALAKAESTFASHSSIYGGLAYLTYSNPSVSSGVLVGTADYKAGLFLGYEFKFNKSWAITTDYSASWDNLHVKTGVPYLDTAKTVGFTYQSLAVGGRFYFHSMFISAGALSAQFDTSGGPKSTKFGGYVGFGGQLDLTKSFFLCVESRYAWVPQVEQIPGHPTNLQGLQSFAGFGFRF